MTKTPAPTTGTRFAIRITTWEMDALSHKRGYSSKSFVGHVGGKYPLRGGGMGAIIFGSILLFAGVVGLRTAGRSVEKFTRIANALAPTSDHRTVLRVGTRIRCCSSWSELACSWQARWVLSSEAGTEKRPIGDPLPDAWTTPVTSFI